MEGMVHKVVPSHIPKDSKARFTPPIHLMRGYVYTIGGSTFFVFGGGYSIDKNRRREGISWWPEEVPTYVEETRGMESLDQHNWKVDDVITHASPGRFLPFLIFGSYQENHLNGYLDMIYQNLTFKKWFCGPYHKEVVRYEDNFYSIYNRIYEITEDTIIKIPSGRRILL